MSSLIALGYGPHFQNAFESIADPTLLPARVVGQRGPVLSLATESGERDAVLAGRLRNEDPLLRPTVGDWVAARPGDPSLVVQLLPRRTQLVRQAAGLRTEAQVLAANVDTVFLVTAVGQELNPRRIERYLAAIAASGATPVIVINKAELADDPAALIEEVRISAGSTPVLAVSALQGQGIEALQPHVPAGSTAVVVGSSGVGKSTLINRLIGESLLATGEVRASDERGRHTTTGRMLIPVALPNGERASIIDTPGLRELQLWAEGASVGEVFTDVQELAAGCRFGDCTHAAEPGCAVREAISRGELDEARLESYRKLEQEKARQAKRQDVRGRQEEKRRGKQMGRIMREIDAINPKRKK